MLAMTKKSGYGLIAMTHLAHLDADQVASAREIADRYGVPISLLTNVLKELCVAGYVESVRGARGGYRLVARPEQVNVGDLVAALEGPIRSSQCVTDQTGSGQECTCMESCPISDPVHRVQRKLNDFLKKLTLAELAEPPVPAAVSFGPVAPAVEPAGQSKE